MNGKRATRWCAASAAALALGITLSTAGAVAASGVDDPTAPLAGDVAAEPVKPPQPTKPPADLRKQQQDEQKKRAQEEARRRAQDEAKKRAQEEAQRRAQDEARKRAADEARRRAQEEAQKRAAEQARQRAQEQARERAAEQARQRAQDEARERAADLARQRAQEDARQRASQEAAKRRAEDAARQRAADLAKQRAQEQARDRAQQEARERAADLARERAQQEARDRAADLARDRAQQEARERAADLARERAQQEARDRAADLARERAQQGARERAVEESRRRNAQDAVRDARTITTPPPARDLADERSRTREPVRVDRDAAEALDRAVENARIRAEAQLRREREAAADSGVIRITPRHDAERIDPVEPGETRITPGRRDRFEVLGEPASRPRTLSPTNLAETAKREAEREVVRGRASIDAGLTLPTRRYAEHNDDRADRGRESGGSGNRANTNDFGNGVTSGSGANFRSPGGAQTLTQRGQLPIERYTRSAPDRSGGRSSRNDRDDYDYSRYGYRDDDHHHHDRYYDKHGYHNYRDFCDNFGYRRYHFYDRWGYSRSCSPWFSFHLFYGWRWRAYSDPYWYWWCQPGYSVRFYYDYASPYYYRPWYTDVRYVTTYQTVYRTEVEYIEVPTPTLPPPLTVNEAWRLIAEGYYQEARRAFSRLSIEKPEDGTRRIGYAIAAGLEFDAGAAVFAMRRAIELDPISVRLVPVDAVLRRRVLDLIDHFAAESRRNEFDKDAFFMVAALNTVIGEDGLAFFALDRALDLGDQETSTYNLESIVRQRMEDRMGNGG